MNQPAPTAYFSLLSGTYCVEEVTYTYSAREVLKVFSKFVRRARFPFRLFFPRPLETQNDYERMLQDREAAFQLARTGRRKCQWTMEFGEGYIYWSYTTLEKTTLDLYLLFQADLLDKVILELALPVVRAQDKRTHYTLARQLNFLPYPAAEIT